MERKFLMLLILVSSVLLFSCNAAEQKSGDNIAGSSGDRDSTSFKVIGYYVPMPEGKTSVGDIQYKYLTSINYAFAGPTSDNSGNVEIYTNRDPDTLHALVKNAHANGVEVFISVGGFNIGDGPGVDKRFEVVANKEESRVTFAHSVMNLIREFDLDGADIDWEFPDAVEPSLSNFVALMQVLSDSLHPAGKKLTAAVESHHLPYTYGIDSRVFDIVDWLNLMGYDNEEFGSHRPHQLQAHAPYWLAIISFDQWIDKQGLPKNKAVMGVPFYGKGVNRQYRPYRTLLARGADPYADAAYSDTGVVYDGVDGFFYMGIKTMKRTTKLAKERGAGIMIWEISSDTSGEYSLLKAIHDAAREK